MLQDRYGNSLSTSSTAARDAYVDGIDRFLAAQSGAEDAFEAAVAADPDFALGQIGLARLRQGMGQGHDIAGPAGRAKELAAGLSRREASHVNALGLLVSGQGPAAYKAIRAHLLDHPRDALVAQTCTGVFGLIGFSGQPGREAEQLAFTASLAPHYGDDWWFLCQHAFSQVEAGQTGPATATIERSMSLNPNNAHGAHIRSHVYYEAGETEAGYGYITDWAKDYDKSGQLHCHISWHIALWALEQGDVETMWRVYDADVAPASGGSAGAWGPPVNVLTDAAALLYRAELAGVEVPAARWRAVSDYAGRVFANPAIAFADVHAALAHAMAGNGEAVAKIAAEAKGPAADIVRELAEAFAAMTAGNWAEAEAHLARTMSSHERIGGSRAQRDLLEYALLNVLLKQGKAEEARLLLSTRRPLKVASAAVKGLN
ncbi:tetratricopeptide repeat protein [Thalassobaculum sp. OXR-137]|uniref:tetratricopeptide repeat protein n=1 Tax=Thalassobaculum sp. OXR-137 TaxID=3100173 RepID=UPI002AC9E72C|nr:tetratricopeptide repeat protein [Thalassobaculum sp. OXR-137]WPZ32272.1 tetratricopeptide repeat protein [Thalassobaculum sp. OXR-137]